MNIFNGCLEQDFFKNISFSEFLRQHPEEFEKAYCIAISLDTDLDELCEANEIPKLKLVMSLNKKSESIVGFLMKEELKPISLEDSEEFIFNEYEGIELRFLSCPKEIKMTEKCFRLKYSNLEDNGILPRNISSFKFIHNKDHVYMNFQLDSSISDH